MCSSLSLASDETDVQCDNDNDKEWKVGSQTPNLRYFRFRRSAMCFIFAPFVNNLGVANKENADNNEKNRYETTHRLYVDVALRR